MLEETLRLLPRRLLEKNRLPILLIGLVAFVLFGSSVHAQNVNLNVEVLPAPSATKNDFQPIASSNTSPDGMVLGAQSTRASSGFVSPKWIFWILPPCIQLSWLETYLFIKIFN